ncbi:MAG: PQQ-binding-like beta-propeller repeat protein [Candidatus Bathyarchaeota archaeon]|nr:PQQ-binding-like beta-propeller repeat protein [Candidatus Bathyarchaeota archaeon]
MKEKNKNIRVITALCLALLMLSSAIFVFSDSTMPTVKAATAKDLMQYEYPKLAGGASNTYFTAGPAPNAPNIQWIATLPTTLHSQIVAFGGLVLVSDVPQIYSSQPGTLYALDPATGQIIWSRPTIGTLSINSIFGIDSTYMIYGSNCVKIADGTTVWTGPPGFSAGLGYIPELKMFLSVAIGWKLNDPSQPPTVAWNRTTNLDYGKYGSESAVAYGDGIVAMSTSLNYLTGVNASTGATMWTVNTKRGGNSGMTYVDGVFSAAGINGVMEGWNATTGEQLWSYNPNSFFNEFFGYHGAAYGMIYSKNQDGYLYAVNATTGQLVWKQKGPGVGFTNQLSIADGKVYVQMGENQYADPLTGIPCHSEFDCFDAYTGELMWSLPIEDGAPRNLQCVAYGNLYIIPTTSKWDNGTFTYSGETGYAGGSNEVWCIGDTPRDWSMFMNDPEHSGVGYGPTHLSLKWSVQTDGALVSSPTLVNGVAYIGSWDGNIYAFNANSGAKIWNYSIGKIGFSSTVAVVNGKLYTGPDDGNVYCLDATTGTKLWQASATVGTGSPIVSGGKVYVAGGSTLYCFDATSGSQVWKYDAGAMIGGTSAAATRGYVAGTPAVDDGAVYIGVNGLFTGIGFNVTKLDAETGAVIFNVVCPGYYAGGPTGAAYPFMQLGSVVVGDGMVFVQGTYRNNYALNATTGEIIWLYQTGNNPGTPEQNQGTGQAGLLYHGGLVYLSDYYSTSCVNATTGIKVWSTYMSREGLAPGLSYSYGVVYVVNEVGTLYVLDAATGAKQSWYQLGGDELHSIPTPYNGSLYLTSMDWKLYCFEEAPTAQDTGPALPTVATLSVAPKFQTLGSTVLFEGTVIAQSLDTQAGVPVAVHLTAIDPNNNFQDIATVACDDAGFFCTTWTPPVPGSYVVTACFEGDQYFLASAAKTAFVVTEVPATNAIVSPTPTPAVTPAPTVPTSTPLQSVSPLPSEAPQPSTSEAPATLTYIAIAVAVIVIVVVAAALVLRRRK